MASDLNSILIFTDGACTGNPGPGGWASVLASPKGRVRELGGFDPHTTNNKMELTAAIRALAALKPPLSTDVVLYTDSTYVIRGITQWIWGWRKRGWKNGEGKDVSNRELWEELSRQVARLKPAAIDWRYSRGHVGTPGNERCDEIAVSFAKTRRADLFEGPLLQYGVAIYDLPETHDLPDIKAKDQAKKVPAFSYLSYQGGVVRRHQTWAECERRVKGQSAAKFKKAKSSADEGEILKGWGLDPKATKIEG
jgi:ribonuclease HI